MLLASSLGNYLPLSGGVVYGLTTFGNSSNNGNVYIQTKWYKCWNCRFFHILDPHQLEDLYKGIMKWRFLRFLYL